MKSIPIFKSASSLKYLISLAVSGSSLFPCPTKDMNVKMKFVHYGELTIFHGYCYFTKSPDTLRSPRSEWFLHYVNSEVANAGIWEGKLNTIL
jgi:hypothetical protein